MSYERRPFFFMRIEEGHIAVGNNRHSEEDEIHIPCSLHLPSSDFLLFSKVKETLKGENFVSDAENLVVEPKWMESKRQTFFMPSTQKWIQRWEKFVA